MNEQQQPVTEEVRIELTSHGRGKVFVNGVEITPVRSINFMSGAGECNEVTITLAPRRVTLTAPAHVTREGEVIEVTNLSSETREFKKLDG